MADPKYADLPGIAYDQADVYETTDLPESEQLPIFTKDENDSVELLHYNAREVFNRFRGKNLMSKGVDFSDRISYKSRTGYNVGFGEWELHRSSGQETPLQKFQRVQFEIKDLYDEMSQLKESAKNEEELKTAVDIMSQVDQVGKQLNSFKLHESLGTELMESLSDLQGYRFKQMISQIELFKQCKKLESDEITTTVEKKEDGALQSGALKYRMMFLPEKARLQEMARIGQLEQRLGRLENLIGNTDEKFSAFSQTLKCHGVLEAVQQLEAKSSVLGSIQLDVVENKLTTLLNRMDSVAQKKLDFTQDSEKEQKISEMYEIVKKIEAVAHIFPQAVNRMITLNGIHQQAAEFSKSLVQLEELQIQISSGLENNKFLLKGVQESFTNNLEIIKKNVISLDERMKNIAK